MKKALVLAVTFVMVLMTACGVSEKDKAMVRGTVENGVFTSEFAGFKFAPRKHGHTLQTKKFWLR